MQELWQDLPEFPGYMVSSLGNIYNSRTKRNRKPTINQQGIAAVTFSVHGGLYTRSIALLVANAFVPFSDNYHYDTPLHKDGDRANCQASNLVWRPRWFARRYHRQFKIDQFHDLRVKVELVDTGERFVGVVEPCVKYSLVFNDILKSAVEGERIPLTKERFVFYK